MTARSTPRSASCRSNWRALGIRALAAAIGAQPDIEKRGDKQVPHVKLQFARITRDDVDDNDLVEE